MALLLSDFENIAKFGKHDRGRRRRVESECPRELPTSNPLAPSYSRPIRAWELASASQGFRLGFPAVQQKHDSYVLKHPIHVIKENNHGDALQREQALNMTHLALIHENGVAALDGLNVKRSPRILCHLEVHVRLEHIT